MGVGRGLEKTSLQWSCLNRDVGCEKDRDRSSILAVAGSTKAQKSPRLARRRRDGWQVKGEQI